LTVDDYRLLLLEVLQRIQALSLIGVVDEFSRRERGAQGKPWKFESDSLGHMRENHLGDYLATIVQSGEGFEDGGFVESRRIVPKCSRHLRLSEFVAGDDVKNLVQQR